MIQCLPDCPSLASAVLAYDVENHVRCECTVGISCSHCLNDASLSAEAIAPVDLTVERNRLRYLFDASTTSFTVISPETILSDEPVVRSKLSLFRFNDT